MCSANRFTSPNFKLLFNSVQDKCKQILAPNFNNVTGLPLNSACQNCSQQEPLRMSDFRRDLIEALLVHMLLK